MNNTLTVTDLQAKLSEANIPFKSRDNKATLQAKYDEYMKSIENELLVPSYDVTSNYEHERELIRLGYGLIDHNLDKTKTFLILELHKLGLPTSFIAPMLNAHYSFVHTIITDQKWEVINRRTKSDDMRDLFEQGYTVSQVAKSTDSHYSFVHGVFKRWQSNGGE